MMVDVFALRRKICEWAFAYGLPVDAAMELIEVSRELEDFRMQEECEKILRTYVKNTSSMALDTEKLAQIEQNPSGTDVIILLAAVRDLQSQNKALIDGVGREAIIAAFEDYYDDEIRLENKQIRKLLQRLTQYVEHESICDPANTCTCGLDEVISDGDKIFHR